MKTISIFAFLLLFLLTGCDKVSPDTNAKYIAQVVAYNLNCHTCIVSFPDDSLKVKNILGASPNSYYQLVNLRQGDYTIGQKLLVEMRNAKDSELDECNPLEVVRQYTYLKLFALDYVNYTNLKFNDTLLLAYKDCFYDEERQSYICLDTVLTDSRCPSGAECVWAGEAIARFKIEKYNSNPVFINLKEGVNDTVVNGYKLSFIKLLPYPSVGNQPKPQEYKAKIVTRNL